MSKFVQLIVISLLGLFVVATVSVVVLHRFWTEENSLESAVSLPAVWRGTGVGGQMVELTLRDGGDAEVSGLVLGTEREEASGRRCMPESSQTVDASASATWAVDSHARVVVAVEGGLVTLTHAAGRFVDADWSELYQELCSGNKVRLDLTRGPTPG